MKYIWEEKDIECGMFVIRQSADLVTKSTDLNFARSVTIKIGFAYDEKNKGLGQTYGACNVFTDGFYYNVGTKADFVRTFNEDEFGYRPLRKDEAILLLNDLKQSLLL